MSLGPVEMLAVKFPGNKFKGDIVPALRELIETNTVRIIDIAFIHKDENGTVEAMELDDLAPDEYADFDPLVGDVTGLFSPADFEELSSQLENNSSAAFMLFENVWATRFRDAVLNARGDILMIERIPKAVIDDILADQPEAAMPPPSQSDGLAQPLM